MSGILLGRHLLALPSPPPTDPVLAHEVRALAPAGKTPVLHVLSAGCRCSQRIAAHLTSTTRPAGVTETVLLLGEDPALEKRLASRGFVVKHATDDGLAAWHIPAVPLLVVGAADGSLPYVGGYTTTKQGYDVHDLELIAAAAHGRPTPLPLYGCAVSEGLKRDLDPTGALR